MRRFLGGGERMRMRERIERRRFMLGGGGWW